MVENTVYLRRTMFEPIVDPIFYLAAIPAVLIAGIGKGGFGGSIGMLATPLIALTTSPLQAAAIMLPILCAMDIMGLFAYRTKASWPNLLRMAPGAVAGIVIGTLTFDVMSEDFIRILIGGIAIAFTISNLIKRSRNTAAAGPSWVKGSVWSCVSGFTSFVAHAGGPPVQVYLLPQRIDKTLYVGTTVWFFFLVNYVKLIPYGFLGQFSTASLGTSLALAPLAPVGIWLGLKLHHRVNEVLFYRIIYIFLILAGAKLLFDGFSGLFAS